MGINDLNDLERGEYDCVVGYQALEGQSEAYYAGYGEQLTVGGMVRCRVSSAKEKGAEKIKRLH